MTVYFKLTYPFVQSCQRPVLKLEEWCLRVSFFSAVAWFCIYFRLFSNSLFFLCRKGKGFWSWFFELRMGGTLSFGALCIFGVNRVQQKLVVSGQAGRACQDRKGGRWRRREMARCRVRFKREIFCWRARREEDHKSKQTRRLWPASKASSRHWEIGPSVCRESEMRIRIRKGLSKGTRWGASPSTDRAKFKAIAEILNVFH